MTARAQYGAIHAIKKAVGIEETEYRALLAHHTGKSSSRELSDHEADRFIAVLRTLQGKPASRPRADRAEGKYAPVLQALWLSGFHLGLIADRTDTAMTRFLHRQTGLGHTRFLVDAGDAQRAIEALKKWLARGGVRWAAYPDTASGRKLAVIEALALALVKAGGFTAFLRPEQEPWPGEFELYGASRGLPERFADYDDTALLTMTRWLSESLWAARRLARGREHAHARH